MTKPSAAHSFSHCHGFAISYFFERERKTSRLRFLIYEIVKHTNPDVFAPSPNETYMNMHLANVPGKAKINGGNYF